MAPDNVSGLICPGAAHMSPEHGMVPG